MNSLTGAVIHTFEPERQSTPWCQAAGVGGVLPSEPNGCFDCGISLVPLVKNAGRGMTQLNAGEKESRRGPGAGDEGICR